jgi:hypothetical protein
LAIRARNKVWGFLGTSLFCGKEKVLSGVKLLCELRSSISVPDIPSTPVVPLVVVTCIVPIENSDKRSYSL